MVALLRAALVECTVVRVVVMLRIDGAGELKVLSAPRIVCAWPVMAVFPLCPAVLFAVA